jgi:hypothetical protein
VSERAAERGRTDPGIGAASSETGRSTVPSEAAGSQPLGLASDPPAWAGADPALIMTTCANCGAELVDRGCKLVCRCGYFLSCSDYV